MTSTDPDEGWLRRADMPSAEPDEATPPAPFDGPTSMADLYPYLSPADRAEYDAARRQLLHTLDHLPRNGQDAWVGELRAECDQEDLAIRRWQRSNES